VASDSECRRELDGLLVELTPLQAALVKPSAPVPVADDTVPIAAALAAARGFVVHLVADTVTALEDAMRVAQGSAHASRDVADQAEKRRLQRDLDAQMQAAETAARDLRAEQSRVALLREAMHEAEVEAAAAAHESAALVLAHEQRARDAITQTEVLVAAAARLAAAVGLPARDAAQCSAVTAAQDLAMATAAARELSAECERRSASIRTLQDEASRLRAATAAATAAAEAAAQAAEAAEVAVAAADERADAAMAASRMAASPASRAASSPGPVTPGMLFSGVAETPSAGGQGVATAEAEVAQLQARLEEREMVIVKLVRGVCRMWLAVV
jgi:hypothetical protein